jgi:drug/metabolite transporter (DMT)-like permease
MKSTAGAELARNPNDDWNKTMSHLSEGINAENGYVCLRSKHLFLRHADCAWLRTTIFTTFAMAAFATNSIICRLALSSAVIDPAGFTAVRLVSGALVLWLLAVSGAIKGQGRTRSSGSWLSAAMLFIYALCFSFAFVHLQAGTGALILFGAVQATMILTAIYRGERPVLLEYFGLAAALAGLTYLVLPGLQAPSLQGAALMALAGTAWGAYSLRGRGAGHPAAVTADNFMRSVPFVLIAGLLLLKDVQFSAEGVLLAVLSGGLASALGYVVWYAALPHLSTTRAALVQLVVPVLAAAGGVIVLSETLSLRLVLSAAMILGGIAVAIKSRRKTV